MTTQQRWMLSFTENSLCVSAVVKCATSLCIDAQKKEKIQSVQQTFTMMGAKSYAQSRLHVEQQCLIEPGASTV
jgi:hypothetical protein